MRTHHRTRDEIVRPYLTVLNLKDWYDAIQANPNRDKFFAWFVNNIAGERVQAGVVEVDSQLGPPGGVVVKLGLDLGPTARG